MTMLEKEISKDIHRKELREFLYSDHPFPKTQEAWDYYCEILSTIIQEINFLHKYKEDRKE